MFINESFSTDKEIFLWNFPSMYEHYFYEQFLINKLDFSEQLINLHNSKKWKGCFGCSCIININTINIFFNKYKLEKIIPFILTRMHRSCLERIISLLFFNENLINIIDCSLFGNIMKVNNAFKLTFNDYINDQNIYLNSVIKVWSGR